MFIQTLMYIKSFLLNIESKKEISYTDISLSLNKKKFKHLQYQ